MKLLNNLLSLLSLCSYRNREQEHRDMYGYTAWHPEYGRVYYPPTHVPANEYNNWLEHGSNDNWDQT